MVIPETPSFMAARPTASVASADRSSILQLGGNATKMVGTYLPKLNETGQRRRQAGGSARDGRIYKIARVHLVSHAGVPQRCRHFLLLIRWLCGLPLLVSMW